MRGYTPSSYGDAFADVYDDWYQAVSDVDATVAAMTALAGDDAHVLELGIGTGRLAIPLAAAGLHVTGIDTSAAMLARLEQHLRDASAAGRVLAGRLSAIQGDMAEGLPDGPFDVVLVAYNTFFNLLTAERQRRCFHTVAERLAPDGAFVIEAFVPDPQAGSSVTVRSMTADRVVLSASVQDLDDQTAEGQYIEFTETGGVRLRPWAIRYAAPAELDDMADAAGLTLASRWGDFDGRQFTADSDRHVSVYRAKAMS